MSALTIWLASCAALGLLAGCWANPGSRVEHIAGAMIGLLSGLLLAGVAALALLLHTAITFILADPLLISWLQTTAASAFLIWAVAVVILTTPTTLE